MMKGILFFTGIFGNSGPLYQPAEQDETGTIKPIHGLMDRAAARRVLESAGYTEYQESGIYDAAKAALNIKYTRE